MLCFRYRKLLIPYSEGDLEPAVARKVERHLVRCARCRTELDGVRLIAGALGESDMPAAEPADDLWARVSAQIADGAVRPALRPAFGLSKGLAAGAVAAVVVAIVGIRLLSPASTTHTSSGNMFAEKPTTRIAEKKTGQNSAKTTEREAVPDAQQPTSPKRSNDTNKPKQPRVKVERRWFAENTTESKTKPVAAKPADAVEVALAPSQEVRSNVSTAVDKSSLFCDRASVSVAADAVTPKAVGGSMIHEPVAASAAAPAFVPAPSCARTVGSSAEDACSDATTAAPTTSVVDDLTETEGVRTAAIFSYP